MKLLLPRSLMTPYSQIQRTILSPHLPSISSEGSILMLIVASSTFLPWPLGLHFLLVFLQPHRLLSASCGRSSPSPTLRNWGSVVGPLPCLHSRAVFGPMALIFLCPLVLLMLVIRPFSIGSLYFLEGPCYPQQLLPNINTWQNHLII